VWVAKQLARIGQVHPRDIGYAGLKDRDAIAEQAFTVPLRSAVGEHWVGASGEGFEVISAQRHRRKLKRGALRGNEFEVVLRAFEGDVDILERRLMVVAEQGAPNYFGPQRFGRAANNIDVALRWFQNGDEPKDRLQRGFAISAARSAIFNSVLAERVREGTWNQLLPGDLANLDGSGSFFSIENIDETLNERCRTLDIHPTGPLWHGASTASKEVQQLEQRVASRYEPLAKGLEHVGLEPERRALRVKVSDLQWSIDAGEVRLSFRLARGAFATAVLNEVIENVGAEEADSG
jgi:tRNA pseudouridine13 synthase